MFNKLLGQASQHLESAVQSKLQEFTGGQSHGSSSQANSSQAQCNSPRPKQAMTSNCSGQKKAVFIGINYTGTKSALRGCIQDVQNISNYLYKNWGFSPQNALVLTDDQKDPQKLPTRANMLSAMRWLVQGAKPNDSLIFHFSGHGSQQKDTEGDEVDGMDETIVPLDYESAGMITDDEIHNILVKQLPEGSRLTCIMDCCHSGTVVDLPFIYNVTGDIEMTISKDHKQEALSILMQAGISYGRGDSRSAMASLKDGLTLYFKPPAHVDNAAQEKAERERASQADVLSFSGCMDTQTSADASIEGNYTGAMSHALISVLSAHPNGLSFTELLKGMRDHLMSGKFKQIPQMTSGRLVELNCPFCL